MARAAAGAGDAAARGEYDAVMRWRLPSRPYGVAVIAAVTLGTLFIVNGWRATRERRAVPPATTTPVPAVTAFASYLAADGQVGFLSWDWKLQGFDSDTAIVFRPNGVAEILLVTALFFPIRGWR